MRSPVIVYAVRLRTDKDGRGVYCTDWRRSQWETTREPRRAEFDTRKQEAQRTLRELLDDKADGWHGGTPTMRALDPATAAVVAFELLEVKP